MCCTRLAGNTGGKSEAKNRHLRTIGQLCRAVYWQLRHVSTIEKKLLNSNISSRCVHNMANCGPLTAEICWRVWGIPTNFNGFRVLASLLPRRRSPEANQTLYDVWPSPGLVHYIYLYIHFRGLLPPDGILPDVNFTLRPSLAFSYIGSVTARHCSSER